MAQDILITPGSGEPQILFRGSGAIDTAVELNVLSSYQSGTGSGTALLFEGTEGQLFGITDNLSSGTIFSVADITGLPTIEVNSDGQVILCEYGSGTIVYNNLLVSGVSTFDQGIKTKINTQADAATVTFDMDQSNVHMVTLGDNRTLAVSNVGVGQKFLVRLQQDSTGSRTVTWWGNIKWAEGGTEPTLTTTAHKADLFGFLSPSGGYYDGFVIGQDI